MDAAKFLEKGGVFARFFISRDYVRSGKKLPERDYVRSGKKLAEWDYVRSQKAIRTVFCSKTRGFIEVDKTISHCPLLKTGNETSIGSFQLLIAIKTELVRSVLENEKKWSEWRRLSSWGELP
jgi:hypothetical protein